MLCLLLCHFHLSLLAIKLIHVAYYPVTLSLPFNSGADHFKQEGVLQNFWCSVFSFGTSLSGYSPCRCPRVILCQLNQSLAALDFDFDSLSFLKN